MSLIEPLQRLADWLGLQSGAIAVILAIYATLGVATFVSDRLMRNAPDRGRSELELRVSSWWVMVSLVVGALFLGRGAALVMFACISFLALKEYLSIIPTRRADREVLFWVYLAIPGQYLLIHYELYGIFIIFVPVYMFLLLPTAMVILGHTEGFLKAVGTLHWGMMMTVYSLGHLAYLLVLPEEGPTIAEGASLVLALLVLTEANDVAQYVWGRSLGKHPILPKVSPKKTWEGFLGGLATTSLIALVLLPLLTPHSGWLALGCGALVAVAGFFGDVTESAVKRDLGIKDSGSLIPGHGGILDRVDSLIFTAPLFFHYTRWFHF